MKKTAVIGGTSESVFICKLLEDKCDLLVFAATDDGLRIMDGIKCEVRVGRLGYDGFREQLACAGCVVDASHPFALEVTAEVKCVCADIGLPYIRYCREKGAYDHDGIIYVRDKEEAAEKLNDTRGRILFTTGAKTARFYEKNVHDFDKRAVMRVMDSEFSHMQCGGMDCTVLYKDPPFSEADNISLIRRFGIDIMVSKDSGVRGGVPEKARSCSECGIPLMLIRAPYEDGTESADDILDFVGKYNM